MTKNNNFDWKENETFTEYKMRKHSEKGLIGLGQSNSQKNSIGLCSNTKEKKYSCKCKTCIARRNRNKGRRKQNQARKLLKIPNNRFHGADAHEENWSTGLRVEVKSGKQVNPLVTVFNRGKAQSDKSHIAFGGMSKPFCHIAMPDGSNTGIISLEIKDLENFCVEVLKNFGYQME